MLWKDRNTPVFENRTIPLENTTTKAISLALEWINAQEDTKTKAKADLPMGGEQNVNAEKRMALEVRTMRYKTDAAWRADRKMAGLAWGFSGPSLQMPIYGSASQPYICSVLIAVAVTMREALSLAANLEFPYLYVYSDNKTLMRSISSNHHTNEIIGDICKISSAFDSISFSYLPRNCLSDLT